MGLDDESPATAANDSSAFAEDHFDERCIFIQFFAQRDGSLGWTDVLKRDDSSFGLRDDFLRDDEHIIVSNLEMLLRARFANQLADGIARDHLANTLDADKLDALHVTPAERILLASCSSSSRLATRVDSPSSWP